MASCSIAAEAKDENTNVPNWLELPRDITANILSRLCPIDIVTSACLVCPLWWNIFKNPLMWRTIHMAEYQSIFCKHYHEYEQIFCYAVNRSYGHLEDIDVFAFVTDDLLECITQNGSNLRSLRLVACQSISNKVFSEAVRKFPLLEELDISQCNLSKDSLEVIGISCPLLKSLKIGRQSLLFNRRWCLSNRADDSEALIISQTMSRLCHLNIKGNRLTNVGLLAILDGCPFLEYLNIKECYNLSLSESLKKRCIGQIKNLRLPILDNYEDFDYEYDDRVTYRDSILDADYHDDLYDPYD